MKLELETKFEIGQLVTLAGMAAISDDPCVFSVNLIEVQCANASDWCLVYHCRLVRNSSDTETSAKMTNAGYVFCEQELIPYEKNAMADWMRAISQLKDILGDAKYEKVGEQDFDSAVKLREASDILKAMADKAK